VTGKIFYVINHRKKFIEINADDSILNDMNETEIRVYYTDEEVSSAGIDKASLRLYYYNSTSNLWEIYDAPFGGVDIVNNYVWAITNHFSIWVVFGNTVTNNINNNNGGSSGIVRKNNDTKKLADEKLTIPAKDEEQNNNKPTEIMNLDNQQNNNAKITGGVIGTLTISGFIFVLAFIFALVGAAVTVNFVRKRKARRYVGDITLGNNTEALEGY
jgi:hypothetical protein